MIRVIVADDHPIVRKGLADVLAGEDGIEVAAQCADGESAAAAAAELAPDVVLMDLQMPGIGGVAATERITAAAARAGRCVRVLVVTMFESDQRLLAAVTAGAEGYLLKASPPEEIVAAVRAVAAGQTVLSPSLAAALARAAVARAARPALTPRETEVLAGVADGLSNAEIAARCFLGESTVKTHLANVFDKLGVSDRTHAVTTALRLGLLPG
ncbi:MAG: response regulator transcription factor [Bifidobacteriaceae bacterium]|nr:response regulator transcription factor [Bifidobacteriaceae bacterium]